MDANNVGVKYADRCQQAMMNLMQPVNVTPKVDDGNDAVANPGAALAAIIDTDGVPVTGRYFYKLLMSDGTELGMTPNTTLDWLADESPSNGGAIIQISKASPLPDPLAALNSGDLAYVRGASYEDGILIKRYLYILKTASGITYVGWTKDVAKATRFQIVQVAGSRVSWRAEDGQYSLGIRLGHKNIALEVDNSSLRLPLAAQFERVQSLPANITIP